MWVSRMPLYHSGGLAVSHLPAKMQPPAYAITATLVTDHSACGGHHRVLVADPLALEQRAVRGVSQGARLEVTVEGRTRSQPAGVGGSPSPVADRAEYHVMDAVRQAAARLTRRLLAPAAPRR
jgi:hypothetical protein